LLENARRARLGLSPADYLQAMGELFAPFTKIAAKNPFSASPVERSVDDLITVSTTNRMICDDDLPGSTTPASPQGGSRTREVSAVMPRSLVNSTSP
jgi:hypothetical protein